MRLFISTNHFLISSRAYLRPINLLVAFLVCASSTFAQLAGRVVGVTDGDTVRVLTESNGKKQEIKVRLDGIDAPETRQPFGEASRQWLAKQVFQKEVLVEKKTTDKYGRTVARLKLNGKDVNLESVRAGMAWWYRQYAKNDQALRKAEQEARGAKRGIWSQKGAIAPWDWRHGGAERKAAARTSGSGSRRTGSTAKVKENSRTVYITRTGSKFHASWCRYLRKSQFAISISDALRQGYDPCSVCGGG